MKGRQFLRLVAVSNPIPNNQYQIPNPRHPMQINVKQFQPEKYAADATAIFCFQDENTLKEQSKMLKSVWESTALVFASKDFEGKKDTGAVVYTGSKKSPRAILIGLGDAKSINLERIRRAAASAAQRAGAFKCKSQ